MSLLKNSLSGKRTFYAALNYIFNSVSTNRIKEVGPDKACAEWLMRNGAFIRWKDQPKFVEHYDGLPSDEKDKAQYFIEEIKAEEASISHHGFPHFEGCNHIKKIRFRNCYYIDDKCLEKLKLLKNTLGHLEVTKCGEVTEKGLSSIKNLKNLTDLSVGLLMNVNDLEECVSDLRSALPKCKINIVKVFKKERIN